MFWRGAAGRLGKAAQSALRSAQSSGSAVESYQNSWPQAIEHRAAAWCRASEDLTSQSFATSSGQGSTRKSESKAADSSSDHADPTDAQAATPEAAASAEADVFAGAEGPADEAASSGRTQSAEEPASASASAPPLPELSADELSQILADKEAALEEQQHLVKEANDRAIRAMADMENMRDRSNRQAETSRKFAVQGFAKSLLDVADNLERAFEVAGEEAKQVESLDPEKAKTLLRSLLDGLQMTDKILVQVFQQNGLVRYRPMKEKFDPNLHSALFEIPDPGQKPGTIAVVTKAGYMLHDRVLRPAEVGVVRQADGASAP